jgi:transposase
MPRPMTVRKPTATELRHVHHWLEKPLQPWQRRRAEVLLLYAANLPTSTIAQLLQVHSNTVYADLRDFARHGLSCLSRPRTVGAPPRLSREQIETIWRLAVQAPTALGLPFGRWSLAKLRAYLIQQRIVKAISREHLRRVLKRGDTASAASNASSSAPIPIGL